MMILHDYGDFRREILTTKRTDFPCINSQDKILTLTETLIAIWVVLR